MEQEVKVGQVWADNDPRAKGRTLRIDSVEGGFAWAEVQTDRAGALVSSVGKRVRIAVSRMNQSHNGYRLLEEAT